MTTSGAVRLGIVGYGFRIRSLSRLMKQITNAQVVSICDIDLERAKVNAHNCEPNAKEIRFFDSADELLDNSELDGVLIGTNCSTHTEMAVKVLKRRIPLYLEKPVCINRQQLGELSMASSLYDPKVVISFPLRVTPLIQQVKKLIDNGETGTIEHAQAVNLVPYGHVYFQSWYRDYEETGGLFLQKATHDFDYLNYLVNRKPVTIAAMTSKRIFTGNRPAGLYCKNCDEKTVCKESVYNPDFITPQDEWMKPEQYMCAFATDAANEDSGSAIIMYDSGMHAVYSQNFFVKNKVGKRGARLMGYDGTLEFDFHTSQINIHDHHKDKSRTYTIETEKAADHCGGDSVLLKNFVGLIRGECPSISTLEDGILSAKMCLAAKESAMTNTFHKIE